MSHLLDFCLCMNKNDQRTQKIIKFFISKVSTLVDSYQVVNPNRD